jgi:glycosyltransferase involved in cell wall biosynthesis
VTEVVLISPESDEVVVNKLFGKIRYISVIVSSNGGISYFINELKFVAKLWKLCRKGKIDMVIARGAPAGGRAALLSFILGIPYIVESFEPHSQYMLDSKVWKPHDLRYVIQRLWERQIKKTAAAVITVSNNYAKHLIAEGMDKNKVFLVPCTVDVETFSQNMLDRETVRGQLDISKNDTVGIYVGKFDDIYLSLNVSLNIFKEAFEHIIDFQLILLSDCTKEALFSAAKLVGCEKWLNKIHVLKVPHQKVPMYLSAADFAYSLVKSGPSKKFCSPLKNGEYWANGLPIIIPENIGDDSDIILRSGLGVVIKKEENYMYVSKLLDLLNRSEHRMQCKALAVKYRSRDLIIKAYESIGLC